MGFQPPLLEIGEVRSGEGTLAVSSDLDELERNSIQPILKSLTCECGDLNVTELRSLESSDPHLTHL